MNEVTGRRIVVTGIVQGVGFRPFIYRLARELDLKGVVYNSGEGVFVEVEGTPERIDRLGERICREHPPLARIDFFDMETIPVKGFGEFTIIGSRGSATGESVVPPDVATCPECRREVLNPEDRHYKYPFTNCTNCGPRFTILKALPYDRANTSMARFSMCEKCAREYEDPADRRFHAQPAACPECGPQVALVDRQGNYIEGDWLENVVQLLSEGEIIAVKGLGGFHLACDAFNKTAVRTLRERKVRPARPLAVMCRDMEITRLHCRVSAEEEDLLVSPRAPIVVLKRRPGSSLPRELAPGLNSLGVMLPYTPLHILLLEYGPGVLVMTSGNRSGLPLVTENSAALSKLGDTAGYFIIHDREIINRCDDSVLCIAAGDTHFFRRSRGYVPSPLPVPCTEGAGETVFLGAGGDLKNTFCLLKGDRTYPGQHIGDTGTVEGAENYRQSLNRFCSIINASPGVVAYDLHPGYHSAALARSLGIPGTTGVQHHHAHMCSCMAENGLDEEVAGVILDGTGYGTDGNTWGFEVLTGDYLDFEREYHLEYLPLPGGDSAVQNPWVTAAAYLFSLPGGQGHELAGEIFPGREREIDMIKKMVEKNFNTPLVSSCGRLFDAMAALWGICFKNTYEGQAAVELGEMVTGEFSADVQSYPFELEEGVIKIKPFLERFLREREKGVPPAQAAKKFHDTLVKIVIDTAEIVCKRRGLRKIVLSGGCWHNFYLLNSVLEILGGKGYEVYTHSKVPPGDGGISLGQAVIAAQRFAAGYIQ